MMATAPATLEKKPLAARAPEPDSLLDLRFRNLLTADAWATLPPSVRRRFSKRLSAGKTVVYRGVITEACRSRTGTWLAEISRMIGAPLPLSDEVGAPAVVTVTEDGSSGGQNWTRLYAYKRGFPQVIHSCKRFAGKTGLEEYLGFGFGMALTVHAENGALLFRSAGYFFQIAGRRFFLPDWLSPGGLTVTHKDLGSGRFSFRLAVEHPVFGPLVTQEGIFRESTV